METAVTPKRPRARNKRLLRRIGSVLYWAILLVLGAFGIYFSFANYPSFATAAALLILLAAGYAERKRRTKQKARDAARRRDRLTP